MMNRGKLEHILAYARQQKQFGSPACRIPPGDIVEIMERLLAQPVSGGYKLPDGYKLMPLEMTDEIGEAIATEARCCGGIALCIYEAALAAAPEGGNDHDTRR